MKREEKNINTFMEENTLGGKKVRNKKNEIKVKVLRKTRISVFNEMFQLRRRS